MVRRLRQREGINLEDFIDSLDIREDHLRLEAKILIENIAKVMNVSPELLRPNDKLFGGGRTGKELGRS